MLLAPTQNEVLVSANTFFQGDIVIYLLPAQSRRELNDTRINGVPFNMKNRFC